MAHAIPFDQWAKRAAAFLAQPSSVKALAQGLRDRWDENDEYSHPANLEYLDWSGTGRRWSTLLELLLEGNQVCTNGYANIINAFEQAFSSFEPNLGKGSLWLYDCTALRIIPLNARSSDQGRAASIILNAFERTCGAEPSDDAETYNELFSIYSLISDALVTEVFENERQSIESSRLMGRRLLRAETPTVFQKIMNFEYSGTNAWTSNYEGQWLEAINGRRKQVANYLFSTISALNADFEHFNRRHNRGFTEIEMYGLQRTLDVPWYRLSRAMLSEQTENCTVARHYIRQVRMAAEPSFLPSEIADKDQGPNEEDRFLPIGFVAEITVVSNDSGPLTFVVNEEIERLARIQDVAVDSGALSVGRCQINEVM